jgi:hypothetical protein
MRVKRFFVSEDVSSELKNLTEARQSGTPGDCSGAVFLVLFYAKKVLRDYLEVKKDSGQAGMTDNNNTRSKVWMGIED